MRTYFKTKTDKMRRTMHTAIVSYLLKPYQTLFQRRYSNLISFFFWMTKKFKNLKYFNDFKNFSVL